MHHNFHNIFKIHRIRKELKEVYANQVIMTFAASLIMIFIPIYLFTIGYTIGESFFLLLVVELMTIFLAIPAGYISSRLGLKHAILYKTPFTILFVLLLYMIPDMGLTIINLAVVGIIWGVSRTFYWIALNSEFVENSDKIHRGEEIGFLIALPILISIGAPVIGAFILEFMGFHILFIVFSVLIVVSSVPLFMTQDYRKFFKFKWKDVDFRLGNKFNLGFFSHGFVSMGEYMIWPFYTYLMLGDIFFTAIVASLSGLGVVFFTLLAGKVADRINRRKMLGIGAIGYFFVWILRYSVSTPMEFFVMSFLGGLFIVLIKIPMFASFSDRAKERNIVNDVSQREIFLSLGRALLFSLIIFGIFGLHEMTIVIGLFSLLLLFVKVK